MGGSYQLSALGPSNLSHVDGGQLQLHFLAWLHSGQHHLLHFVFAFWPQVGWHLAGWQEGKYKGGGVNMAREVCGGNSVTQQNSAKLTDLIHGSHSNLTRFSCVFAEDTNHIVWHAATLFIITFYSLGTPRK